MRQMLRWILVVLVAVIGISAWPTDVGAGPHTVRGAGKDHARDAFSFRAEGTPSQATGRLRIDPGSSPRIEGTVDCLAVRGRRAALTGRLTPPVAGFEFFRLMVEDNGPTERRPRDKYDFGASDFPLNCADFLDEDLFRIKRGEIRVD
jgi:hypothetical protein